jgi:CRISPR-associated endoribonuclease Cas6
MHPILRERSEGIWPNGTVASPELTAVVLSLRAMGDGCLPQSHGALAHAAGMDLILRLDPVLARQLHRDSSRTPVTIGPLWNRSPITSERGRFCVTAGTFYDWRITGITARISELLMQFSPSLGGLRIGEAVFAIENTAAAADQLAACDGDLHAGQETYAGLVERWRGAVPPEILTLRFCSPTTFRSARFEQPFPLPRWVFGSLVDTWNAWAPCGLDVSRELIEEKVVLSNWQGATRRVELIRNRTVGFLGRFTYRIMEHDPDLRRALGMLAEFALYAGVGWQTTHGMGQVRPGSHGDR